MNNNIKYNYFLPLGNAIEYEKIKEYRVVFEYNKSNSLPEIYCFDTLESATDFSKTLIDTKYITINAVLSHKGLYIEDNKGKYLETQENKRYSYKKINIITEVPIGELYKKYYISIY